MRTLRVAAAAAGLFGSMLLLPATTEAQNAMPGIPGFPVPLPGSSAGTMQLLPTTTALQRTGTITVTINAAISSNIPISQAVTCQVEIVASDVSFFNFGLASAVLTRSGKGGTCKVAVPYIFEVASPKTVLLVAAFLLSTNSTFTLQYEAFHAFAPFPVPSGNKSLTISLAI
jgi:hypothetical protein